jgi:uncharacterized membrane protein YphA (DoxX/SURF4 family)
MDDFDRPRWLRAASGLLGVVFALSGASKLAGADEQVSEFERFGYPQWFRVLTGGLEVSGGTLLLLALLSPVLAVLGGLTAAVVMAGAVATHLLVRDPPGDALPAAVLGVAATAVTALSARARSTDDGTRSDGDGARPEVT